MFSLFFIQVFRDFHIIAYIFYKYLEIFLFRYGVRDYNLNV